MHAVHGMTHILVLFSIHQVHIKVPHLLPLRSMRIPYHIWTEQPTQHRCPLHILGAKLQAVFLLLS